MWAYDVKSTRTPTEVQKQNLNVHVWGLRFNPQHLQELSILNASVAHYISIVHLHDWNKKLTYRSKENCLGCMRSLFQSPTSPSTVSFSAPYIMSCNVYILSINVLKSVAKKQFFYRGASMIFSTKNSNIWWRITNDEPMNQWLRGPLNCKHWD